MRRTLVSLRNKCGVFVFGAAFVALLPFMLPVAAIQSQLHTRRLLKLVSDFVCLTCGTRLGAEALRLADERWATTIADRQAKYPGVKYRLVRDMHAVCPGCGCEYTYLDADRSLARRATT
jgi:hypothetical protein